MHDLATQNKDRSPPPKMQPRYFDWALYPAFIPDPWALHPALSSCPETVRQAETPAKKRPFTVEFLLSKSPSEVRRGQPPERRVRFYPGAGCAPVPGVYPVLCQGAGHSWPRYSAWDMCCADWRTWQSAVTHPIPATDRKLKRFRAIFTQEQLAVLEGEFKKQRYIVGPQRVALASALGLTVLQVKVWFQNRRIKWKKDAEKSQRVKTAAQGESQGRSVSAPAEDAPSTEGSSRDLSANQKLPVC
ncbi:homeobox protein notochord-like [Pristis pectinata]|uniref:homeobox protein notochord-like n=1 Tax=Pristis pectinata TaxID=685728 RepID=UPI00223DD1C3|nr:homeobox protein notochord-like [Pristis pectinata]